VQRQTETRQHSGNRYPAKVQNPEKIKIQALMKTYSATSQLVYKEKLDLFSEY
jgi:hypothetical protein